jgi:hypothetical protein
MPKQLVDDATYVKERLPLYAAQNYAYRKAMMEAQLDNIFGFAATGIVTGFITSTASSPWNWLTGLATTICTLGVVFGTMYRQRTLKQIFELSKNSLAREHMDAAEEQLKDRRFRGIILDPEFNTKFREDHIKFYLIPPGP